MAKNATFIDESGDTGHDATSLPYFRVAAVWVHSRDTAEAFREAVHGVRKQLRLKTGHEFKFHRTHDKPNHRQLFFEAALSVTFRFAACAIDKTNGVWRTATAEEIHRTCGEALAVSLRETYREAETALPDRPSGKPQLLHELVVVDDNEDARYLKALEKGLFALTSLKQPGVRLVGKVKFRGSGPEEMIQLADMVCGAVGAHLDPHGDSQWFRSIRSRCVGLVIPPGNEPGREA